MYSTFIPQNSVRLLVVQKIPDYFDRYSMFYLDKPNNIIDSSKQHFEGKFNIMEVTHLGYFDTYQEILNNFPEYTL